MQATTPTLILTPESLHPRQQDRLSASFDAVEQSGGYRDVLINIVFGHAADGSVQLVTELQLHLESLLAIKETSGHSNYEMTRALHMLEPVFTSVQEVLNLGPPSEDKSKCGGDGSGGGGGSSRSKGAQRRRGSSVTSRTHCSALFRNISSGRVRAVILDNSPSLYDKRSVLQELVAALRGTHCAVRKRPKPKLYNYNS